MLDNKPAGWSAEALWQQLEPLLPGLSVEVVARTDSTSTRLLERARATSGRRDGPITRPGALDAIPEPHTPHGRRQGDTSPCLLVAELQTSGRGRLGRNWQASPGASLTFSLSLPLAPADWSGLSLAVGVALAEALEPQAGGLADASSQPPRIGLKWPNDLWLMDAPGRGRKLGGVLIETVAVGQRRLCVVGVGLNVLPQPTHDLSSGYACLQEIDPLATAPRAMAALALPLVVSLLRFEREGLAPFAAAFARRDLLIGQPVSTTLAEVPEGVAEGVDERGALRVRAGSLHALVSGEVSVRLKAAPPAPDAAGGAAC
jgi:BirA family transcriptional regulator, biotin operon repressor / biotin---[acetyl-CoA-carboxylase] ligase